MKIVFSDPNGISSIQLAQNARGTLQCERGKEICVHGICTDSREADADTAFAALAGERADGHDYIGNAIQKGCRCIIAERTCEEAENSGAAVILVKDSEMALSYLAQAHLNNLSVKTVAVTGSVGKTTTKDMIASVLKQKKKTYASAGNHNSVIGMPLSALQISEDTEYAILEMGMSALGEIERMSLASCPSIAVITNVGTSHIELLGSRKNICRAKLEVLCGLQDGGTLILNGDEPLLAGIGGKSYHTQYVSLSNPRATFFADRIRVGVDKTEFDIVWKGQTDSDFCIPVSGKHNVYAALYAFAVGTIAGMSPEEIRKGLMQFVPGEMRQNRYALGNFTVLEDCYNASPESMMAAIDVLHENAVQSGGRSIAVLADMLELGSHSIALHRRVGAYLAERGIDRLITLGKGGAEIAHGAYDAGYSKEAITAFSDPDAVREAAEWIRNEVRDKDTVLFKASRGMRLERLIQEIKTNIDRP